MLFCRRVFRKDWEGKNRGKVGSREGDRQASGEGRTGVGRRQSPALPQGASIPDWTLGAGCLSGFIPYFSPTWGAAYPEGQIAPRLYRQFHARLCLLSRAVHEPHGAYPVAYGPTLLSAPRLPGRLSRGERDGRGRLGFTGLLLCRPKPLGVADGTSARSHRRGRLRSHRRDACATLRREEHAMTRFRRGGRWKPESPV